MNTAPEAPAQIVQMWSAHTAPEGAAWTNGRGYGPPLRFGHGLGGAAPAIGWFLVLMELLYTLGGT
jgi:hypothetical protein